MKKIILIFFGVLFNVSVSQNITVNQTFTAQQLIENILVNSGCVSVSNFSASGGNFSAGEMSFGYFNANGSVFPFQEGIVLSTGKLSSVVGPNTNFSDFNIKMDRISLANFSSSIIIHLIIKSMLIIFG